MSTHPPIPYEGNDKLLFGLIMGVLTFWLFAQTILNVSPLMAQDLGVQPTLMNIAVSITALFSGIFIVVIGGLADRFGRIRTVQWGFVFSITGSLLLALAPTGAMGSTFLTLGRICQGLSGAFIMPASLALVKAYWQGAGRQRAVSLWSMGSWGGSGFAALFGGLMAQNLGWRSIFLAGAALSVLGMLMIRGTPESRAQSRAGYKLDLSGMMTFMVAMVTLQVFATQGARFGWDSALSLGLLALAIIFGLLFFHLERRKPNAFVNFGLFRNMTYTGATISNFLLNGAAGIMIVSMTLMQLGGNMDAQQTGLLTIGYAISIVLFIRVGEKLLQRFGPRRPMIWGTIIVVASIMLLMQTNVMLSTYKTLAIVAYTLFGLGLAFYATPSTDAALSSLPSDQAGAGAGIYKMASSLGASFGVAISSAVFTALSADNSAVAWIDKFITYVGRQDNLALREAAFFGLAVSLLMVLAATASIVSTVPKTQSRIEQ